MEFKIDKKKTKVISELIQISVIKQVIEKYSSENNNFKNEINDNTKIIEKLDKFLQNNLISKNSILKFKKYIKFFNGIKNITKKEYNDSNKNKIIFTISICILRKYINKCNHFEIRKYIKALLCFYINGNISINNFCFILEIILISIIDLLKKNSSKQYQIFDIKKDPLLFINDIIEAIKNFPIMMLKDDIFIDNLINVFNNFFSNAEKNNIIIKEYEIWLKLFENNSINISYELYEDDSYQNNTKKLIDFLMKIYDNNLPKKFYNEIYTKSSIDLVYYINSLSILKEFIKKEISFQKKLRIEKGLYFLGNIYKKEHLLFSSNEFSIIFSLYLLHNNTDTNVLNLNQKGKDIFRISLKDNCLYIEINKDFKFNSGIKINKKIFYFICIVYNKKNKCLEIYINNDEVIDKKTKEKKIEKLNVNNPKFGKDIDVIIGDVNLYAILGDIFIINKEFDIKNIKPLFNSKGNYGNMIIRSNVNCDLINSNISYSKNYEGIIDNFKALKYEYNLLFTPKLFIPKENENQSLLEFNYINCFTEFFNSNGIEFLGFMLHNIDSKITDNKLLDIFISKVLEFLSCILEYKNDIENDFIFEINKENIKNQLNIFFFTLFSILKPEQDNKKNKYFRILSDDIWYSLLKIFSLDLENSNSYKQIILSILLDNDLFEQRDYINELNDILDKIKIEVINDELLYKIFLIDFIFESDSVNHRNFRNLINSICVSKNQNFCKALINYVIKVENEIKNYHYLKIIYVNIKDLKKILSSDIYCLYEFIEQQFNYLNQFHCKYCLYIIILGYLIKQEIITEKEENRSDIFTISKFSYMDNPSYLFLRSIFIENFNLNNEIKLKFIKSKDAKCLFNQDIFKKLEFHPFELYHVKKFLVRFKSILKYIDFLMNLESNENLKNFFEYFFKFIIEFAEKIRLRYTKNIFIQEDINKYVNEFYSSEEFKDFYVTFIKYDKKKALELIIKLINLSFFKDYNPFYLKLLDPEYIILEEENSSNEIKFEIIKNILDLINNYKKGKRENLKNIFLFLNLLYKNIYQIDLKNKFSRDFPNLFISLFHFLKEKNILLSYIPINLTEKENNNTKYKLVCEIILDIIFKFFFRGNYSDQLIKSLLILSNNSSTIFFEKDEKKLNGKIKSIIDRDESDKSGSDEEKEEEKFNFEEINDFSFCVYFLIYFFKKDLMYQEQDKKNVIKFFLDIIFKDLKNLFVQNKKISSKMKKIKIQGKNFDIYNEILDICHKNYLDENFNLEFLQEKYNQINNTFKDDKENDEENKNIIKEENFDENEVENENKNEVAPEQYHKNFINNNTSNEEDKNNNNEENNTKENNNDITSMNYLKEELSMIDISNYYFKLIVTEDYSKDLTKILFNPKEYYIWKKFSFYFKNFIFYSKKFTKVNKSFKIHLSKSKYKRLNNYGESNPNFYLNYPTKLRNYTIDEYYRPFLKPCLNFFNSEFLSVSHRYIKENILKKLEHKEENISLIKFKRMIPKLNNDKQKYFCELFKNKGNIFGYIELTHKFFIFKNSPSDDLSSSDDPEKCFPFLLSISDDKIIDKDKYVLIFYEDIKEIIKRRVCLLYIGIEIFLKDNRSYMFNFFDKNAINKFIDEIKKYTQDKNKLLFKASTVVNEDSEKKGKRRNTVKYSSSNSSNTISNVNVISQNKSEINFKLIEDPIYEFKKLQLKEKNKKGSLSNFNYLLLINKYSSRSYNDYNQYLVFPLLYMDINNQIKRDLSKAICLNKENNQGSYNKSISNYNIFKFHFNQHYSTGGYILYYLVRVIPFTYQHILFQSMRFDVPTRLFSSLNNIYLFFQITEDNRELIPEFYSSFYFLANLNFNDFGVLETSKEIYHLNNVETNCKYSFPEFIIKSRNNLEKSDLSPWIDNIFGAKQTFFSNEQPNLFPLKSYEEFSELEEILEKDLPLKEKVGEIKENVDMFKFGTIPAKVFNKPHEKMGGINIIREKEEEINTIDKKEEKIMNNINKYIQKKIKEKEEFYLINTKKDNEIELIFKFRNKIDIFKLKFGETKSTEISLKIQEQIFLEPFNNSFCEISPEIFCTVRHIDNTISFVSKKQIIATYHFNCLITAVENKNNKSSEDKCKEIFIGDERGFLHLLEIKFDYNQGQKNYEIKKIKIKNSVKVHEGSITGLLHCERLNVIFSWSDENEDYICISNDYNLNLMNVIKTEKNICIKEILVSKYDLIFIRYYEKLSGYYKVFCYTLNGIKVSYYDSHEKIIKIFIDEKINIVYWNNNGLSFYLYTFDEIIKNFFCDFTKDYKAFELKINFCQYYPQIKKYLMICSDNKAYFLKNDKDFI